MQKQTHSDVPSWLFDTRYYFMRSPGAPRRGQTPCDFRSVPLTGLPPARHRARPPRRDRLHTPRCPLRPRGCRVNSSVRASAPSLSPPRGSHRLVRSLHRVRFSGRHACGASVGSNRSRLRAPFLSPALSSCLLTKPWSGLCFLEASGMSSAWGHAQLSRVI